MTRNAVFAVSAKPRLRAAVFVCALLAGCGAEPAEKRIPRRIVSLAPSLTEILFAIGAGDRVVGTDDFSDAPAAAAQLPKVGGVQPNVERIAELKPDLVLASASANTSALAAPLQAAGIRLMVIKTDRIAEIEAAMRQLGARLDAPRTTAALEEMRAAIDAQRRTRARKPRVLFVAWTSPLFVAGRETFANDVMELTGAQNVVQQSGWPQYSLEAIAADPPDLLLHPNRSVTEEGIRTILPKLGAKTKAVAVDESLFSRPGPRIGETAAKLNAVLDRETMNAER